MARIRDGAGYDHFYDNVKREVMGVVDVDGALWLKSEPGNLCLYPPKAPSSACSPRHFGRRPSLAQAGAVREVQAGEVAPTSVL